MTFQMKAFRPSAEKVYHLDVHPTQPWLVTSDGGSNVIVWDWEQRQVLYELRARGVDERQLVDTKLQKIAEGESDSKGRPIAVESIRGGSVKDIKFYDDDVRYWSAWHARAAAAESPTVTAAAAAILPPIGPMPLALRGRRFLVMCCENKVIFLDLITMRSKDIPKAFFDNRTPICVEFLSRLNGCGDGPFAAFGFSDGAIRVLSLALWQVVRKFVGGHKGYVNDLLAFVASNGEMLLVSGGADGAMVMWSTEAVGNVATREVTPKLSIPKAHDSGVYSITLSRVSGAPPQLITCGADKTLAIWDTLQCKELRRAKPVPKMVCQGVAAWRHPGAPHIEVLTCVKDSHIWAVDSRGFTSALVDLNRHIPPTPQITAGKKLKMYCMATHVLQPHIVVVGTNVGVVIAEYSPTWLPAAAPLPTPPDSREHSAVYADRKGLNVVIFQVGVPGPPVPGDVSSNGPVSATTPGARLPAAPPADSQRVLPDTPDANTPQVKQWRNGVATLQHSSPANLSVSKSGKYVAVVFPDVPAYTIHAASDWRILDSGAARHLAWDVARDRYAVLTAMALPQYTRASGGGGLFSKSSRSKARAERAEQEAAAANAAAAAAAAATARVEVHEITAAGEALTVAHSLQHGGPGIRSEPIVALHGGALLGVAYRMPKKTPPLVNVAASAVSAGQGGDTLSGLAPGAAEEQVALEDLPANFVLFSWDTLAPVSPLLPQPEWSAWDPIVEHCALAYEGYVAIAVLRPQFRYLGNVHVGAATGGAWHRRQLFLATRTSIECVFVDAGVSAVDLERQKKRAEERRKAAEAKAMSEQGELAVLALDPPNKAEETPERVQLRPPMLQVVRLASFNTPTGVPQIEGLTPPKTAVESVVSELLDGPVARAPEVVTAGGGVHVAPTRLPPEHRRPPGPLVVVGVRDGFLWLVDRFMWVHAIALSHPGIRCRCLAAYGDPVSSVKWASRLGREHHDDLAQFLVGMGYAREALHLPGISKRFEFNLAMQVGELARALQCLHVLSGTADKAEAAAAEAAPDTTGVLALAASHAIKIESAAGIARFAKEYVELIDRADAQGQADVAAQALRRLAMAGVVEGALAPPELRALILRLSVHKEEYRLHMQCMAMVKAGMGHEAALSAALLGDADLLEKAWHDTGMLPQAALHAQAHGRPSLRVLLQHWNRTLQKQQQRDAAGQSAIASYFLALFQKSQLPSTLPGPLGPKRQPPAVEVVPPGQFSSAADGPLAGGQLAGLPGVAQPGIGGGGIQGLKQPLDLSLLEGAGLRGPAPQKGPATIAVPVKFDILEKKDGPATVPNGPAAAMQNGTAQPTEGQELLVAPTEIGTEEAGASIVDGVGNGVAAAPLSNGAASPQSPLPPRPRPAVAAARPAAKNFSIDYLDSAFIAVNAPERQEELSELDSAGNHVAVPPPAAAAQPALPPAGAEDEEEVTFWKFPS